ncbi:MAG: DUF4395 family protein [Anaerolineae bacterium]|nr:DUF4395 family protein [Anaerolineae bacterium]
MATIKIPTPLRQYSGGQAEVSVGGATVAEALDSLLAQYPDLKPHLYDGESLRSFVNIFLGDDDIRFLSGTATAISSDARLRIIPAIAGGAEHSREISLRKVDHHAIRTGLALTISLLLLAFILDAPLLVLLVALSQLLGGLNLPFAPYRLIHQALVQRGVVKPHIITDNPEPHRFALLVGALFDAIGGLLVLIGQTWGWTLVWVVIVLANLNLWLNFCLGCWMYYQLHKLGVPGFNVSPIARQE